MTNDEKAIRLLLLQNLLITRVGHLVLSVLYIVASLAMKKEAREETMKQVQDEWKKAQEEFKADIDKVIRGEE